MLWKYTFLKRERLNVCLLVIKLLSRKGCGIVASLVKRKKNQENKFAEILSLIYDCNSDL
jgi:hypothetical protein